MRSFYACLFALLLALPATAQQDLAPIKHLPSRATAASFGGGCNQGTAETRLDVGGVEALLFNNGAFFWKGGENVYEVPRGFGVDAIFAAGIWLGGTVNGDLRFAGSDYGPYEYWPGPLDASGAVDPATCAQFDRFWTVAQADIEAYDAGGSATPDMASWPIAYGAPFYVDANGNSQRDDTEPVTEFDLGDPGYGTRTIDLAAGERPLVYGSQTVWWVMNDAGGDHNWSDSDDPLGVEIRVSAFGVSDASQPELDRSTFYRFSVHNRSSQTIDDAILGFWNDPDLGFFSDDLVGSDPSRGMFYTYNGDNLDEGQDGYGFPPPALGFDWLSGSSATMTWNNNSGVSGNPQDGADAYNFLQAQWRDASPLTEGGDGYQTGNPTNWFYSGDAVTESFWSEEDIDGQGTRNIPSDRRGLLSAEAVTLAPGASHVYDLAIIYGVGADRLASITALRDADDAVQTLYDSGDLFDAVSPSQNPPPPAPAAAASLLTPPDGATFTTGSVSFSWSAVADAEWYQLEIATSDDFSSVLSSFRVEGTAFDFPPDAIPTNRQDPMHWRVTAANRSGDGPPSDSRSFTYYIFEAGVLFVDGDTPAFVEIASPSGIDPCGASAISTHGCAEVGGNLVINSFNSDGTYILGTLGTAGSEASLAAYTPHDYEIRFTSGGSYGFYAFSSGNLIAVPFEIWDVGNEPPFSVPDASDDVQMVPVLFADGGGECAFNFGEGEAFDRPATDRIYAYYPVDADQDGDVDNADYAAFEVLAAAAVAANPNGCPTDPATAPAAGQIDFGAGRPLQRQVFVDNSDTGDVAVLQGAIVKFYTTAAGAQNPTANEPLADGARIALGRAFPNPAAGAFSVPYTLREAGAARVVVHDALGREVAVLASGTHTAGAHRATLDTSALASGVYTVLLESGEDRAIQRVAVVR